MVYCESVISAEHPEMHGFLKDSTQDTAKSWAVRHLSSEIRELYEDMLERYRNVLPGLTDKARMEPGEHQYQYGRPEALR